MKNSVELLILATKLSSALSWVTDHSYECLDDLPRSLGKLKELAAEADLFLKAHDRQQEPVWVVTVSDHEG